MKINEIQFDHKIEIPYEIFKNLNSKTFKRYKANEVVYRQGEMAENFFFLKEGRVQIFVNSPDGMEKIITFYSSGEVFGEASFFDGYPRISSAKAVRNSEIIAINKQDIISLFKNDPLIAFKFIELLSKKVRMLSREINNISFLSAEQRIARYLLNHDKDSKGTLKCTHEDIGKAVGASRITVNRILNKFSENGWIETGYRNITLLDTESLMDHSG
ncbi:Crp/Fnr family transcriptional regulator [Alkalibacter mobilis]|uniref:Crp/Fnr family transcriptional regulator n=1 Tax=Alkalibacter mobilis TaxID=2787712 RepID=UPI00189F95AA|nr:Crp/Fnr family transcriptional regulator [Alkalibacter mobilis]MBF7097528.1 Crp/Fnr family transcriptional regulator [Alkalibacter mobilis]